MDLRKWTRALLVTAPFLAGCQGFWQSPGTGSSSGCTSNCTTLSSGDFYILTNGTTPQVQGESIVSGKLTAISGSPWNLTAPPFSMAISPNGSYLYVSTTAGVYVYPISNGTLVTASAASVSPDPDAVAIAVDTSGQWLIEARQVSVGANSVTMAAIPISTSTGLDNGAEATPASYTVQGEAVENGKIAVAPSDNYVFVALGAGGTLAVPFTAGVGAGHSPFGSTAPVVAVGHSGGSALSVAVDPAGDLFYIGESLGNSAGTSGGLRVFTLASLGGTLVQATGSPIASGGLAPNAILPVVGSAGSGFIYVANGEGTTSSGNITSFAITSNGTTYTVATGSTVTAGLGLQPFSLAEDAESNFVLDANEDGDPYFSSYTFDTTTSGDLDVQITADTGGSTLQVVAAPQ